MDEYKDTDHIQAYCEHCDALQPVSIYLVKDTIYPEQGIWGDMLCAQCGFVIATVSGNEEGEYRIAIDS